MNKKYFYSWMALICLLLLWLFVAVSPSFSFFEFSIVSSMSALVYIFIKLEMGEIIKRGDNSNGL